MGAIGSDDNGSALSAAMVGAGISTEWLRVVPGESGQAFIVVDRSAENTIIVASGANATVTELTGEDRAQLERSAAVLMQLELPLSVVEEAARVAHYAGATVMLNAAPAHRLPDGLLAELDLLIVNEHEALIVSALEDLGAASAQLALRVPRVVVTLGGEGSVLYENGAELARIPAREVTPVDTTGAGDTFCGALAAALAEGRDFVAAASFATTAAALSVQKVGAVPSIPDRTEIDSF